MREGNETLFLSFSSSFSSPLSLYLSSSLLFSSPGESGQVTQQRQVCVCVCVRESVCVCVWGGGGRYESCAGRLFNPNPRCKVGRVRVRGCVCVCVLGMGIINRRSINFSVTISSI